MPRKELHRSLFNKPASFMLIRNGDAEFGRYTFSYAENKFWIKAITMKMLLNLYTCLIHELPTKNRFSQS